MKHAYLVMAHEPSYTLLKSLALIDDDRNDVFIHFDSEMKNVEDFQNRIMEGIKKSKVVFIPRRKVYWGDISQAETELDLLQAACNGGGV